VPEYRLKQKNVFSFLRNESVDRSSFTSVGSLYHARGTATEEALSLIRRHVRGMTRSPQETEHREQHVWQQQQFLCAVLMRCLHEAIVAAIGRATDRRDNRLV